jgi:hypothetical protein
MHLHESILRAAAAAGLCAALAACGSGGGGAGDVGGGVQLTIDESRARASANAYRVATLMFDTGSSIGALATGVATETAPPAESVATVVARRLLASTSLAAPGPGLATGVQIVETENCAVSGTSTSTIDDADGDELPSVGETGSVTFTNCVEAGGLMLNGSLSYTVTYFDQGGSEILLSLQMIFNNLTSSRGGTTVASIAGSSNVDITVAEGPPETLRVGMSGTELAISGPGATGTLQDYILVVTHELAANTYLFYLRSDAVLPNQPGVVQLGTDLPFAGTAGQDPSVGELVIGFADGSASRVVALSSTQVRVEIDANGDGVYETGQDFTWDELRSL